MANWYGTSRTNCVHPTDIVMLEASLKPFAIDMQYDQEKNLVMFMDEGGEGWLSFSIEDDETVFEWETHVMPFIQEEDVLVVMQVGAEKHCYVTGYAQAFIRRGEQVDFISLGLNDIYRKASESFFVPLDDISAAEY